MIIFARHGETIFGSEGRFEGYSDSWLTEKGKNQAHLLKAILIGMQPSRIFVSPRGRAVATAEIVTATLRLDIKVDERLREVCYGSWETMQRTEVARSPSWRKREDNFLDFKHPGYYEGVRGESYRELYHRVAPFFSEISELSAEFVLVIAHSGIIRCARKFFEGINDAEFKDSKFNNSVILEVKNHNHKKEVVLRDLAQTS